MSERGPIVCGTDLSDASQVTVELAARLAGALERPLHLVCVTGALVEDAEPTSEAERVYRERLKNRVDSARRGLDKVKGRAEALGPHTEAHLLGGRPWEALLEHAESVEASIVAVGPHGHAGPIQTTRENLSEWLLGSTADRVVRHARCPVLVGPREGGEHAHTISDGDWVVAVDFSPQSKAAVGLAHSMAAACKATITVVHALVSPLVGLDPAGDAEPFPPMMAGEKARVESELKGLVKGEVGEELPVHLAVGEASEVIADVASAKDAKLVVMGTHGRTGLAHFLLGSVAERTLRRSAAPVLVVPS